MNAAMAVPGNTAATFLVHFFGSGLADQKYVVERFKAHADGDIRPWSGEAPAKGKGRRAKRVTATLKAVRELRPARTEIIVCTGLRTRGGQQLRTSQAAPARSAPQLQHCSTTLSSRLVTTRVHAEDARHEVPPRDALGRLNKQRPKPFLMSVADIGKLLTAALSMGPAGTIAPLTWHYLFGLVAATGLRIGEALALTLDDITEDGLVVRDTKFRKSRMVALHPTTWDALNRYLEARLAEKTPDRHLFVIASGRPPRRLHPIHVFRRLAEQTGIREPGAARGPTTHSLRHSFAVRSLENLAPDVDPSRHMLALSTYLGHVEVSSTYWYLEATPVLMRGIAEAAEEAHANGGSDD